MSRVITSLAVLLFAGTMQAGIIVGLVGTEPGTPIGGEEDIVIYNSTGPVFGCSTPDGTPVCTAATFDNVALTINGAITLDLGNIAPGSEETVNDPNGVFVDGSIKSLALSLSLSTTSLVNDLHQFINVKPTILVTNLPVDGSLASINATLIAPEPVTLPLTLFILILLMSRALKKRAAGIR